jgi:ribonuclease HII
MSADLTLERDLCAQGHLHVAGIDEAGRGAWAGPVVAAAVILPLHRADLAEALAGVDDSKKLTAGRRERLFDRICSVAAAVGVGAAGPTEIDGRGIVPSTRAAMCRALAALAVLPTYLLIDYVALSATDLPFTALPKGDAKSLSIAAASIVAKVTRDRLMCGLHEMYPDYGFDAHKGYGVRRHRLALRRLGATPVHRVSFAPVSDLACAEQLPLLT